MFFWTFLTLPLALTASITRAQDANEIHVGKRLPSPTWHHSDDHHVHRLFGRAPGDAVDFAPVGSPAWSSGFPTSTPDASKLPTEWVDALNAAVAAGKIPNIPQSSNTPGVNPVYPPGVNPDGPEVCSATHKCINPGDIWDAPPGVFGTSFDDGPVPEGARLRDFLQNNSVTTTHFMIGVNILQNPQEFLATFNGGADIAVHTWTHPYMTTLSNLDIVAQLGWSMVLIRNSTGGRVPKFWRPPFGDSDNRVRAIAKEVFDLTTIIWNRDTEDWSLTTGATTLDKVHSSLQQWLTGPKSPGLIILEHEISDQAVQAFIDAFPLIKSNGWNIVSVTQLGGSSTYQNAQNSTSPVTSSGISADHTSGTSAGSQSQSTQPSSSSSSSSPTTTGNGFASSKIPPPQSSSAAGHSLSSISRLPSLAFGAVFVAFMT